MKKRHLFSLFIFTLFCLTVPYFSQAEVLQASPIGSSSMQDKHENDVDTEQLNRRISGSESEKLSMEGKNRSRWNLYADVGGGFLSLPKIFQSFSPQGASYGWSPGISSLQALGITKLGTSVALFRSDSDLENQSEFKINVRIHFEGGVGYVNQQASPFFQTLVGPSSDMVYGPVRFGVKLMGGYAYFPKPTVLVTNQLTLLQSDQIPQHFGAFSGSLSIALILDRWASQKGWEVYLEPQYIYYSAPKDDNPIGFIASLGFRHEF